MTDAAGRERRAAARETISDILAKAVTYSPGFGSVNVADARAFVGKTTEAILDTLTPTDAASAAAISDQTAYIALTAIDVFLAEADRKHDWSEYEAARADLQRVVDAGASAAAGSVAVNENELIKMVAELLYRYRPTKNNQEDSITDAERAVRRLIERSAAESAEASAE